jgi:hypothetical protein
MRRAYDPTQFRPVLTQLQFCSEFANAMSMITHIMTEISEDHDTVGVGWWPDPGICFHVDMEEPYRQYLSDPSQLDAIISALCEASHAKLPEYNYRGRDL